MREDAESLCEWWVYIYIVPFARGVPINTANIAYLRMHISHATLPLCHTSGPLRQSEPPRESWARGRCNYPSWNLSKVQEQNLCSCEAEHIQAFSIWFKSDRTGPATVLSPENQWLLSVLRKSQIRRWYCAVFLHRWGFGNIHLSQVKCSQVMASATFSDLSLRIFVLWLFLPRQTLPSVPWLSKCCNQEGFLMKAWESQHVTVQTASLD